MWRADDKRIRDREDSFCSYLKRLEIYKSLGYDVEKEKRALLESCYPLGGRILEIGTGKGYLTTALARVVEKFTTVDICKEQIEFARSVLRQLGLDGKINFVISDARKLSFRNHSFDVVISSCTLHHFYDDIFGYIDEFIRVTDFGGKIVLSDFTRCGFNLIDEVRKKEGKNHFYNFVDFESIKCYLDKKGFKTKIRTTTFEQHLLAYYKIY